MKRSCFDFMTDKVSGILRDLVDNMTVGWAWICGLLAAVSVVVATRNYDYPLRCECHGRARVCAWDSEGLVCVDCKGNTEGRHCERCKAGFYSQRPELSCRPCHCDPRGSVSSSCDPRGRCRCKDGFSGDKCDQCPDGTIGPEGCVRRRVSREESRSPVCFCHGHTDQCVQQAGFSIHNISSTFSSGVDGWKVTNADGVTPANVRLRWSPKHEDVEVISENSRPVYFYAPASFLGNQLRSYGQTFSFALRLDRITRSPLATDVVLEGSGLRVSTSLGEMQQVAPCGTKLLYTFRLDEQPGSSWHPKLSSVQFLTLLSNLTAIKIRGTSGEHGRGYLDNVGLVSAQRGDGTPARWVQTCSCPPGYMGDFCEQCSAGFRRQTPAQGAFSTCVPCNCRGGSCDPLTGDCYSSDETPGELVCSPGFYRDPWRPHTCVKCPCPPGESCSLPVGSLTPICHVCPTGTTGVDCAECQEGFYGRPDEQQPCRPCQCNGHIDVRVAGSCDRRSGECLKCLNNTMGPKCDVCLPGFYHSRATESCKPCNCDVEGSDHGQCDKNGRCECRVGFQGLKCQQSNCPSCFNAVKAKLATLAAKLQELQNLVPKEGETPKPADTAEIEALLKRLEFLVDEMQDTRNELAESEKRLQTRLTSNDRLRVAEDKNVQKVEDIAAGIKEKQKTYQTKVTQLQDLMANLRKQLEDAKKDLLAAELPSGDNPVTSNELRPLAETAKDLAEDHRETASATEQQAGDALSDSRKSLDLVKTLMPREYKVKELIDNLKSAYDETAAKVRSLENQGVRQSGEARDESKIAKGILKEVMRLEGDLPEPPQGEMDATLDRLEQVKKVVDDTISGYEALQDRVQREKDTVDNLLAENDAAKQVFDDLVDRVKDADAQTTEALKRIKDRTSELDNSLNTVRGFDKQIKDSSNQAEDFIKRLPAIDATIKQAVRDNNELKPQKKQVEDDLSKGKETINQLDGLVNDVEGTLRSLPPLTGLKNDATKLHKEAKDLKDKASRTAAGLGSELAVAKKREKDAQEASNNAAEASDNSRRAVDDVRKTLQHVTRLLDQANQPGTVDEADVKRLEEALANIQKNVNGSLKPRLDDMEDQEEAYRRRLNTIDQDIGTILEDIKNLEDIRDKIPEGCFNSPPIELP
ncbi:laminin subunit gamma-2 isoform 1-T1 [Synchiropus picturatus]